MITCEFINVANNKIIFYLKNYLLLDIKIDFEHPQVRDPGPLNHVQRQIISLLLYKSYNSRL